MACRGARSIWAIPTTANARRPAACWPKRLNLAPEQYRICFQSRFGRPNGCNPTPPPRWKHWRKEGRGGSMSSAPASSPTAWKRWKKSPWKARPASSRSGGKEYPLHSGTQRRPELAEALTALVERHLGGWPSKTEADPACAGRHRPASQIARRPLLKPAKAA